MPFAATPLRFDGMPEPCAAGLTAPDRDTRRSPRSLALLLGAALALGIGATLVPTPAAAEFRLCNRTQSRVGIALGYKDGDAWATEGWWNVSANSCETLLRGDLSARFYYLYAVDYDQGGEWAGKAFMCTREKEFTIKGAEDCLARGFDRTGFFEVDTQEQKSWTVQLTESSQTKQGQAPAPLPPPAPRAKP
ncbi:DUF1036 domain-containing protein [Xanthobacter flavus]|uniref:DUF1036 domain-containing protein n=1 Tax=Xanthobacter flavus TaxID=281 RepID=UPI00372859D7